jgi:hypothetical protein
MKNIASLAGIAIGAVLIASPAEAACPRFLIATGYADLCSPSAWMAFEHNNDRDNRIIKRRLHNDHVARPAKIQIKPRKK